MSRLRNSEKEKARENHGLKKEVIGTMKSGETHTLAETLGTGWSLMNSHWSLHPSKNSGGDCHTFELVGNKMVGNHPYNIFPIYHCSKLFNIFPQSRTNIYDSFSVNYDKSHSC